MLLLKKKKQTIKKILKTNQAKFIKTKIIHK